MNESFNQNIRNLGVGVAATVASVGISEDAVAQQGLLGKIKDKIQDKIELVSHRDQEPKQSENPEIKKDSIFYNDVNDHEGYKYPFDKEYKTDENFYRTVAYANMKGEGMTSEQLLQHSEAEAEMNAQFNILRQEMGLEGEIKFYQENNQEPQIKFGDKKIHLGYVKIIDKANFRDTRTGVCTTVLAVEISKKGIKIEKTEPSTEIQKTRNEKIEENISGEWQKYKVEKPEEIPMRNKPKEQPVYNPSSKAEKQDYHVTFEDFKKVKEAELESNKKAKESEFENYKKSQEEEFSKFMEGK